MVIDHSVSKDLKRVPRNIASRVFSVIEELQYDPYVGDIEKMSGEKNLWRRRTGDYRIFYEVLVREKTLRVMHVARRTSKTY
ncbi:MAG: Addiction module toxin, RelE/StbE family [Parcubacteria group bacterium Gr01-1014_70]|nr:MAG: Addiction module toxin, RelE/StbE family [Parcubacteria group bacterium Gr01-1014_70]